MNNPKMLFFGAITIEENEKKSKRKPINNVETNVIKLKLKLKQ